MNKMHVKTGDTVVVISGKNKGKKGKVLKAFPEANRVIVESVNMATMHKKPTKDNPQGALRSLIRCEERDGDWYYMQGKVLMALEEYDSAHQSFRQAVKLDPDNNVYRAGALAAAVAYQKEQKLPGKMNMRRLERRLCAKDSGKNCWSGLLLRRMRRR